MPNIDESEIIIDPFQRPIPCDPGNEKGYIPLPPLPQQQPFDEPTPGSGYVPTQPPPIIIVPQPSPPDPPAQEQQGDD